MSRAIVPPTLAQALQVAWEVASCSTCGSKGKLLVWPEGEATPCPDCQGAGAAGELSPQVVLWIARLALYHPQVGPTVGQLVLPSSGLKWGSPWSQGIRVGEHSISMRISPDGEILGRIIGHRLLGELEYQWDWHTCGDSGVVHENPVGAYTEVDERLLGRRWLLQGAVFRRPTTCGTCGGRGYLDNPESEIRHECSSCGGRGSRVYGRSTTVSLG